MKKLVLAFGIVVCVLLAQEKVDEATTAKIRSEEMEHSQIMHIEHMLTDRYGPRVTGTPNHEAAAKWAVAEMAKWGLKNGHLEGWDFARAGWLNERASGFITAPVKQNLKFEVLGWTPSTTGTVTASAVELVPPQGPLVPVDANARGGRGGRGGGRGPQYLPPTKEEFAQWIAANKDKVRGKMVLMGKAAVIPVDFDEPVKRTPDDRVKAQYDPDHPEGGGRGNFGGGRGPTDPARMDTREMAKQLDAMLMEGGAVVRLNDAARGNGIIVAQANNSYDVTKAPPTVILRNDDYGRIERLLADGDDVKLEFNIVNHTLSRGQDQLQRGGGDSGFRQSRRGGHARRPPGFLALGHGRHGQRHRVCHHDRGRAVDSVDGVEAAADHPGGTVVGRRGRAARFAGVCEGTFRHRRKSQAGVVQAGLLFQRRYRHRTHSRRQRVRTAGSRRGAAAGVHGVRGFRRGRRQHHQQPGHRRDGQHVVQQRRHCRVWARNRTPSNTTP